VTAEKTVEVGADLVALTLSESVALSTTGLEEVGTLLCVTVRETHFAICKNRRGKQEKSQALEEELEGRVVEVSKGERW